MHIPQRAGAAAPAVRPARRFSIGRGGEAGSAACARIRARDAPADVMEIENLIRYTALAVGLMEIEHLIRYTTLAVGLKPSAMRGEARLRGLERIISSKTISPRLAKAKPACAGYTGLFTQRPSRPRCAHEAPLTRGWRGASARASAGAAALFAPSARQFSVGRSSGRLPERIRTHQRGRGSALRAFSPTLMEIENLIRYPA
jgi:hypothetical protein